LFKVAVTGSRQLDRRHADANGPLRWRHSNRANAAINRRGYRVPISRLVGLRAFPRCPITWFNGGLKRGCPVNSGWDIPLEPDPVDTGVGKLAKPLDFCGTATRFVPSPW